MRKRSEIQNRFACFTNQRISFRAHLLPSVSYDIQLEQMNAYNYVGIFCKSTKFISRLFYSKKDFSVSTMCPDFPNLFFSMEIRTNKNTSKRPTKYISRFFILSKILALVRCVRISQIYFFQWKSG